jgi:hypothetical protein
MKGLKRDWNHLKSMPNGFRLGFLIYYFQIDIYSHKVSGTTLEFLSLVTIPQGKLGLSPQRQIFSWLVRDGVQGLCWLCFSDSSIALRNCSTAMTCGAFKESFAV